MYQPSDCGRSGIGGSGTASVCLVVYSGSGASFVCAFCSIFVLAHTSLGDLGGTGGRGGGGSSFFVVDPIRTNSDVSHCLCICASSWTRAQVARKKRDGLAPGTPKERLDAIATDLWQFTELLHKKDFELVAQIEDYEEKFKREFKFL